jgi:uncharacterized membrane protein (UPF0127 family)
MEKIALLPGGFKPPHAGHYNMAKWLASNTDVNTVVVKVGAKEREGITRGMSLQLWDLYRSTDPDPIAKKLTILPSTSNSPVADVYDFIEQEAPEGSTIYLGMGEKDMEDARFKNIGKFADPKNITFKTTLVPPQAGGVSGTKMRDFIKNNNKESFQKYLPDHIDKDKAWDLVSSIQEDFYDPRNKALDFMKSSEWKAGMPDGPKDDIPRHGDRIHNRQTSPVSWEESINESRGGESELHIYDFDETIARVETPIPYTVESPEGKIIEKGETSSIEFEKTKDNLKDLHGGNSKINWDFKAFANLINKGTLNNKIFQKLLKSIKNPNAKVTILTARAIGLPVTKFLKDQGIWAYVVPLGLNKEKGQPVTGEDKANWIENRLKNTTKKVIFIDDAPENRKAIYTLRDKHPNIEFSVETPPEIEEMRGTMNNQEKAKHAKNLKRLKKDTAKQGDQYMEVPDYLKGTLKRKLYENTAVIHDKFIPLEVMDTTDLQLQGMMGRNKLKGGMVFPYNDLAKREFHMQNCKISLDILFMDNNKINKIEYSAPPCNGEGCPKYSGKADTILELPGGYCKKHNVNIGDHIGINLYDIPEPEDTQSHNRRWVVNEILNELSDREIKFFAIHSDILKQLNTSNFKLKFIELQQKLKGERLEALEYFWDEYFSNLDDSCEVEGSFDKKVNETKYGGHDILSQYKEKIQLDYGHQQYRNLQTLLIQFKDEEVETWLKSKGYITKNNENYPPYKANQVQQVKYKASDVFTRDIKKAEKMGYKEGALTKNWWKKVINEILLTEGGAAGHMAHPFNLPNVNSGKDLKDIFNKSAESLNKNPGAVKIDGVNSSIRLVDLEGKKQFAMDRGSKKPLDMKGITKADLEDRFKPGHGMVKVGGEVLDMFNEALPTLKNDLEKLGAWNDPNILFNMEYVSGKTNVQDYGSNFIAIHGLNKIESKKVQGKRGPLTKRISTEISYDKSALQSMLDNLKPIAKKNDFEVYGSVPTEMTKSPNFNNALSKTYKVKFNDEDKSQTLDNWLNELTTIPEEDFIFIDVNGTKKKVGAVSKQVYQAILNGGNVDELFGDDKEKAIAGFTTYLATEKLGDEVLKVLNSPMGTVDNHEGVVIRDEKIANVPFKITGKFILGGMVSDF